MSAGPALLYGTCTISVLDICRKSSAARCEKLPDPEEPKLRAPGLARARAMNSFGLVAWTDGCTVSINGPVVIIPIGAMPLIGS
jgi:hypothetical protein